VCSYCGVEVANPRQCVICEGLFCDEHVERIKIGEIKKGKFKRDVYAYVCINCLEEVKKLKEKPIEEWGEEEKGKFGSMVKNVLKALGIAGLVVITALFSFAFKLLKGLLGGEEGEGEGEAEIEEPLGEIISFTAAEDSTFTEGETFRESWEDSTLSSSL